MFFDNVIYHFTYRLHLLRAQPAARIVAIMLVLWALFFMFGIHMTTGVTEYHSQPEFERNADLKEHQDLLLYFGRLEDSIMSLFKAMSGGSLGVLAWLKVLFARAMTLARGSTNIHLFHG